MPTEVTQQITYCDECYACQVNDVGDHYCHCWHRKTDPWGYCYRGEPMSEIKPHKVKSSAKKK